jgi:hypothetical protein
MGHPVDQEMAQSRRGPDLETEAAWQAHCIKWAEIFGMPDPCGYYKGFIRFVAIYIKYVQCGINYNNKQVLCSTTVQGYADVVNNLFKLRSFSPPANLSNPNNMMAILLNNMLQEEDIARQGALLNNNFFAKLRQMATASKCEDSVNDLLFDIVALGRYIRPCLSEYSQTTQDKFNHHTYPSGKTVIKAFIASNFIFYDEKKRIVKDLNEDSLQRARFVKITWRIQKNCQNGQSITLVAESDLPEICLVCSAMQLVLWARRLNQPDDMPIAVYKTKKGKVIYLTGNKIAELLRKVIKKVRPDTTPDKLKQYSSHSLRVWACVLLDEAVKLPDYIKKRLLWLGDSFMMYLRDIAIIQHQHVDALLAALQEVMDPFPALPTDIIALSTMTEGPDDPDMHKYADKMN